LHSVEIGSETDSRTNKSEICWHHDGCQSVGSNIHAEATPTSSPAASFINLAEVLSESTDKMKLRRLLEQYGLEDETDVLASNGIKKYRDLSFIDDDVIKDFTLSPVSKAKLRKLLETLGAQSPEETSESVHDMDVDQGGASKDDNGDLPIGNKVFV
jgi:hypothetical protein